MGQATKSSDFGSGGRSRSRPRRSTVPVDRARDIGTLEPIFLYRDEATQSIFDKPFDEVFFSSNMLKAGLIGVSVAVTLIATLHIGGSFVTPYKTKASVAVTQSRQLNLDEVAALMQRARSLIAIGDIPAARLLLERAADAQDPGATLLLAQTYDPEMLGTPDARSMAPDPAAAQSWYLKAARLGSPVAKQRLAQTNN